MTDVKWPTLILTVAAGTACATHMGRVQVALDGYERSLRLSASVDSNHASIGESLPLHMSLANVTTQAVEGCLGVTTRYRFLAIPFQFREGKPPFGDQGATIDHPYCKQRFVLAPGEVLSWEHRVTISDVGAGAAELQASVSVVYPHECERLYGCYDTMLSAPSVRLELARVEP